MITTRFANAALTGTPTAPTAAAYTNTTQIATTAQVYSTVTTVIHNYQSTTAYTLTANDAGKIVFLDSSSAITLTIPADSSVNYAVDTRIDIVAWGSGTLTVSPSVGVTLRSSGSKTKLAGQYSGGTLLKVNPNDWLLIGDLA